MDELTALSHAVDLARRAGRTAPNPRVGCVILAPDGTVLGEGFHPGAGAPHAEVEALAAAGDARGATAVVTLEPCSHTGRTGPCTQALLDAGIARVVIGRRDPFPPAAGGLEVLRSAGVDVAVAEPEPGLADRLARLNEHWERAAVLGRPYTIWKAAATLDGRVAAADGSARWITGPQARAQVHELRSEVDAVLVGTGTALTDDPHLGVRLPDADESTDQPLRVVLGERELPPGARLLDETAPTLHLPHREPARALAQLWEAGVRSVLLEGGPTVAAAFLRAGLIDRVVWFTAPVLLGAGPAALGDLGITSIAGARRLRVIAVAQVGGDIRIDAVATESTDGTDGTESTEED